MITPGYCLTMARYNAWQNRQLTGALDGLPLEKLTADRGGFFGSVLGTLNHLLWADRIWMNRFDPALVDRPAGGISDSVNICPTSGAWSAERFALDGKISEWAGRVTAVRLAGDMEFTSSVLKGRVRRPVAPCVVHMFNHQTHHRGQVHAMITAMGLEAPVSDLFLMPEDI